MAVRIAEIAVAKNASIKLYRAALLTVIAALPVMATIPAFIQ
jgi:hypothetical protein